MWGRRHVPGAYTVSTTIGVVVGAFVPPAGSTVTPILSPCSSPEASTGAVLPPVAGGTPPARRAVPRPGDHSSEALEAGSARRPRLGDTLLPSRTDATPGGRPPPAA